MGDDGEYLRSIFDGFLVWVHFTESLERGEEVGMDLERKDEEELEAFMASAAASIEKKSRKKGAVVMEERGGWAEVQRGVEEIRRKESLKKREKAY